MTNLNKLFISLGIIIFTALIIYTIFETKPKVKRNKVIKVFKIPVETMKLKEQEYTIYVDSYGYVSAKIQSNLNAEISGKITYVSEKLQNGETFLKNDLLLQIEDSDYIADVQIAQAALILAEQELLEEESRSKQASDDWQRIGRNQKANQLVLRVPQLKTAQANVLASNAKLSKANTALSRTKIKAPYNGMVLKKEVNIAEIVSSNTLLATIYATSTAQVNLPVRNKELALINLNKNPNKDSFDVTFYSDLIGNQEWKGRILRTESSIDVSSSLLHLIVEINSAFNPRDTHKNLLKISQYLRAKIKGKTIPNALVIPNSSIYQGSYVYVEKDGIIKRREIKILWQNNQDSVISGGLEAEEHIVLTTLGVVSSGTAVKVINKNRNNNKSDKGKK